MADSKSASSSFFSEDATSLVWRHVGTPTPVNENGCAADRNPSQAAGPNSVDSESFNFRGDFDPIKGQTVHYEHHALLFDREANNSITFWRAPVDALDSYVCKEPYIGVADEVKTSTVQNEYSLFSSSLSELISRNLRLATDALSNNSNDNVTARYDEDKASETSAEPGVQSVGMLLPDENLFYDVVDGLDHVSQTHSEDHSEELDLFHTVGGMGLGNAGAAAVEKSSRSLVLRGAREVFKASMVADHPGIELSSGPLVVKVEDGKKSEEDISPLGLALPSSRSPVCGNELQHGLDADRDINILETPYVTDNEGSDIQDVKAAETSDKFDSTGIRRTRVELGHYSNSLSQFSLECDLEVLSPTSPQSSDDGAYGYTDGSEFNENKSGDLGYDTIKNQRLLEYQVWARDDVNLEQPGVVANNQFCGISSSKHTFEVDGASRPENRSGPHSSSGKLHTVRNAHQTMPSSCLMQFNSPVILNEMCCAHLPDGLLNSAPFTCHMALPMNNCNFGSAPSIIWSPWGHSKHAYARVHEASGFRLGPLFGMSNPYSSLHHNNLYACVTGNCMAIPPVTKSGGNILSNGHMTNFMNPLHIERARTRRSERRANHTEKKLFELDIHRIMQGEDTRTTLMIKNIPNKYTSKMLMATIDERHKGTYDFIYLPIDFKNKCNVGYAFINMTDPSLIVPFYQSFNGKKWEKFNSEKVASLAYARIQGRAALISHFQNSSLLSEDKQCRPILFSSEGLQAGDQVPFPVKKSIRSRTHRSETRFDSC